jgi:hypothetical protein
LDALVSLDRVREGSDGEREGPVAIQRRRRLDEPLELRGDVTRFVGDPTAQEGDPRLDLRVVVGDPIQSPRRIRVLSAPEGEDSEAVAGSELMGDERRELLQRRAGFVPGAHVVVRQGQSQESPSLVLARKIVPAGHGGRAWDRGVHGLGIAAPQERQNNRQREQAAHGELIAARARPDRLVASTDRRCDTPESIARMLGELGDGPTAVLAVTEDPSPARGDLVGVRTR